MEADFRIAKSSDVETLVQLIREFCEFDQHPFDEYSIRTTLAKLLNNSSLGRVWVIQQNREAIGYIVLAFGYSLEYGGRDAFIDEFFIRENTDKKE